MTTATTKVNVLVVGGGIGGLATAAFLRQSGHDVTVLEQAAALRPVGTGIVLHINTVRVLEMLGLSADLEAPWIVDPSHACARRKRRRARRRRSLRRRSLSGKKTIALHRADLHELLAAAVGTANIRLGASFSSLSASADGVNVRFNDGSEARFDLVVGADGINSKTREALFGPLPLRYQRLYLLAKYRCPAGEAARCRRDDRAGRQRASRRRSPPFGRGRAYVYLTANTEAADPRMASAKLDDLARASFAGFGGSIPEVLASMQSSDPIRHDDLYDLESGRLVSPTHLAARRCRPRHDPEPRAGSSHGDRRRQSASICARYALRRQCGPHCVQKIRRPRVMQIRKASWDAGRVNQWSSGPAVTFRNLLYKVFAVEEPSAKKLRSLIDGGDAVQDLLAHRPDLPQMTDASRNIVRFLVKMGQIDGYFDDQERAFIQASLHEFREHVSPNEIETLSAEVNNVDITEIVAPFKTSSQQEREHVVCTSGISLRSRMATSRSESAEALDEVRKHLDISREAYDRITASSLASSLFYPTRSDASRLARPLSIESIDEVRSFFVRRILHDPTPSDVINSDRPRARLRVEDGGRATAVHITLTRPAISLARERAPQVVSAKGMTGVALSSRSGARLSSLTNPYLEIFADRGSVGTRDLTLNADLWIPVEVGGQRSLRMAESDALITWAGTGLDAARATAMAEVVRAYGSAIVASERVKISDVILTTARNEDARSLPIAPRGQRRDRARCSAREPRGQPKPSSAHRGPSRSLASSRRSCSLTRARAATSPPIQRHNSTRQRRAPMPLPSHRSIAQSIALLTFSPPCARLIPFT